MKSSSNTVTDLPVDWPTRRGQAAGTAGLSGRIRLRVADNTVGCLKIADGTVEIVPDGAAEASVIADTKQTLVGLLGGEKHPVVARLQGQVSTVGDVAFVVRVFLGLQAGSPWSGLVRRDRP